MFIIEKMKKTSYNIYLKVCQKIKNIRNIKNI